MTSKVILLFGLLSITIHSQIIFAHEHEKESRVVIASDFTTPIQAGPFQYVFELVDKKTNKSLLGSDLNVTHERKLHLLAYDPALKEFQHVHPAFDGRYWRVDLNFSVDGEYWLWAQGEIAIDNEEFSVFTRLKVQGGQGAWPTPPQLIDLRSGEDSNSVATLDNQRLRAGKMVMMNLAFSRKDGSTPALTPYLGAFAHVVAVFDDADTLIHVHSMDTENPSQGMLHVTFPHAGFYRLWVQFIDAGQIKTVPLSVEVF